MKIFDTPISPGTLDFLNGHIGGIPDFETANGIMLSFFNIINFYGNQQDFDDFKFELGQQDNQEAVSQRSVAYGDFQTNAALALRVTGHLKRNGIDPQVVIEPTCGKGNFIIAALKTFDNIGRIYGIELYKPYTWETKLNIIGFYLENNITRKPEIRILHDDIFGFDFGGIIKGVNSDKLLILGNPPWVTNSQIGTLSLDNLPVKSNFKEHNGIDAITGKGNFDIGEYITLKLLSLFHNQNGYMALLLKNAVIKNVLTSQKKRPYNIANMQNHRIDSKKEFNAAVEASLFSCQLNSAPQYHCTEFDFYNNSIPPKEFGWVSDNFVSNIDDYLHTREIDGVSPFEWRQGVKHDCSPVMELEYTDRYFVNNLDEKIELEKDLIYSLLKSSDVKNNTVISSSRKYTIITQRKAGQNTDFIQFNYPLTYNYLDSHRQYFDARKSIIYNNKPAFSIFGIGEYSFKPYKVAISGLYKQYRFSLVLPDGDKPLMLDDTCYFIGFDSIGDAACSYLILNHPKTRIFLEAITFPDAKRIFTKEILMRIDMAKLAELIPQRYIQGGIERLNADFALNIDMNCWDEFVGSISLKDVQIKLFA